MAPTWKGSSPKLSSLRPQRGSRARIGVGGAHDDRPAFARVEDPARLGALDLGDPLDQVGIPGLAQPPPTAGTWWWAPAGCDPIPSRRPGPARAAPRRDRSAADPAAAAWVATPGIRSFLPASARREDRRCAARAAGRGWRRRARRAQALPRARRSRTRGKLRKPPRPGPRVVDVARAIGSTCARSIGTGRAAGAGHESSTSRRRRAIDSGVNGFCRNGVPCSLTPCRTTLSSV